MNHLYPLTLALLFCCLATWLPAQCPITVDAGPNKFVCTPGQTVQLDGSVSGGYLAVRWTPATGLNDPTILNPTATVNGPVTYTLTAAAFDPAAPNLVTNPAFEQGNTGFTTSLSYNPIPALPGTYTLTTSPALVLAAFPPCDDHTFGDGTGNLMLINGNGLPNNQVWCQVIPVMANSWYYLSAWSIVSPISPPTLQFAVNNSLVGDPFSHPSPGCDWREFTATWFSGVSTTANVCIRNLNTSGNGLFGDDFALDDIFMSKACTVTDQVTVNVATVNAVLPPSITLPCSALPGGIQLNGSASSSGPGYTYFWDGPGIVSGQGTPIATVNEPGIYTLTVLFDTGNEICSKTATINVLPDPLQVEAAASGGEELTCVQKTTQLSGAGSSTGPQISYNWQPGAGVIAGQGTLTPTVNQPGTYTLTVTHNISGCTATATVFVPQNITPVTAVASAPGPITCVPGTVKLNGTGSTTGFDISYQWAGPGIVSGANTLNDCVVNAPGIYTLTVTNEVNGCTATAAVPVTQSLALPTAVANAEAPGALDCVTPTLVLNSTGSSQGPAFSYLWSTPNGNFAGPVNGPTATVASAGSYILTVTNNQNGCTKTDTVSVAGNFAPPTIVIKKPFPTLNCAQDSVQINASLSANGPEFSYVWTTPNGHILSGDSTLTPWVDSVGIYILHGFNSANGCSAVDTAVIVLDTVPPLVVIELPMPLNCLADTVQLDASASSHGPRIALHWGFSGNAPGFVSGDTTLMPVVNAPGFYILTLTDTLNFCTTTDSVEVLQDTAPPTADAGTDGVLTCDQGAVVLDGNGSSQGPEFAYQWTGGSTALELTVTAPGTYTITVTNTASGCTATDSATVGQNEDVPEASIDQPEALTCVQTELELSASASAGPEFTYTWAYVGNGAGILSGETTLMPIVGSSGAYTLLVTNTETGCTNAATVLVEEDAQAPDANLTASGALDCSTTEVVLTNSSSTDPSLLNHDWANPNGSTGNTGTDPTWLASAPGPYALLLTNTANGCTATATVEVVQQSAVTLDVTVQADASCFGAADGALAVTANGGNGVFTYLWSTGQETPNLENLPAGTYTVTVTDGDDCSAAISLTVQQPDELVANATATQETTPGANNGTASANPTGGTAPYTYWWNTGENAQTISGLAPGLYTVTATDTNGCTTEQTVEVFGSGCSLSTSVSGTDPTCHGLANGTATATAAGGPAPFAYTWSSGATTMTAENLAPGTYTVTVLDANGCDAVAEIVLDEPPLLTLELVNAVNTNCPNSAEGSATVAAAGGTGTLSIGWSNGQQGPESTGLVAGTYTATATDANGCAATVQVEITGNDTQPPVIQAGAAPLPLGAAGAVTLTVQNLGLVVTDNCAVSEVSFVPASFDCSKLGVQTVTVTAEDASGNSSTLTFDVTVVDQEAPKVVCPADIRRCFGDNLVAYTAPVATDNCLGLGGQFDLVSGLPSGSAFPVGTTTTIYTFTDASGNVGSCSFQVTVLSELVVTLDTILADIGNQNIGGVQVTVSGSLPGYTYEWRQGGQPIATTQDLSGAGAGQYTLLVTDAHGCTRVAGPFEVSNTVSTSTADWSRRIAVYPNPTTGTVFVVLPDDLVHASVQVSVFDALGRTVQEYRAIGQKQLVLDWTRLADGLYTVLIRNGQGQAAYRVVLGR